MASITINIPDASVTRVLNGMAKYYEYSPTVIDGTGQSIPNPETKAQFAKRIIIEMVMTAVVNAEANVAADTAKTAVSTDIKTNVVIT